MNSPPVNSKQDSVSTTTTSSSSVQRRKSSLSLGARFNGGVGKTFKVIVLGQASVGKTALTVRFVTKRFIWEYDPTLEMIYKHRVLPPPDENGQDYPVEFEILDTAGQEEYSEEKLKWADAFIIVYSITDRCSFEEVMRLTFLCCRAKRNCSYEPVVLIIGNKTDLKYDRIVGRNEAQTLSEALKCSFLELSVRESHEDVQKAFLTLYNDFKCRKKTPGNLSPKFLGKKRRGQSNSYPKIDLDSNPPKPRERSISFTGLSDLWNGNILLPESEVITEEDIKPMKAIIS
ncbi:putative ras-related and estrogen-regulated growth inhibitor [Apostichopus japonicus]|uniref:small monomeric GTPase n=1 Tax=Stichopus japonicus TaxID=307972 RepID=A0A2G8JYJ9_STIJA|nr:putative ras-related and estrogen-regulated growth inhibitor [Apostichopus japonicus]